MPPAAGFAAIAAVLTLGLLALVLRPLWQRPVVTISIVAALSLATLVLYRLVGTPAALDPAMREAPATLQDAISQLETRLQENPRQIEGWLLLGGAYASTQQPGKARDAYARAALLAPDQPDVLVEAAETRALVAPQRRFDAQALAWLQHALQLQPQHQRARWFLGVAQRQAGKPVEAAVTWEPLLAQVDATTAMALRVQINAARVNAGLPPLRMPPATARLAAADTGATMLQVKVQLDPQLAKRIRLDRNASVFVIARMPGGPPMPVAVEKHTVAELPLNVVLDDSDGPMPTRKLSSLGEVEVLARLSMSGNALPQPGDLSSTAIRVQLPTIAPIELNIGADN